MDTDKILEAVNQGIDEHRATIASDQKLAQNRRKDSKEPTLSQIVKMLAQILSEIDVLKAMQA